MWAKHKQSGFTIVELLIVIVVIAILAAITIVSYGGIQQKAKISTVQSELVNLRQSAELYKVDNGTYPVDNNGLKQIFVNTKLWDLTRTSTRTYMICSSSAAITFVSINYISTFYGTDGDKLYYVISGSTPGILLFNASITGASAGDRICTQPGIPTSTFRLWAHSIS